MKTCQMKIEYLGSTDENGLEEILTGVAVASRISRSPKKAGELMEFINKKTYQENVDFIRKVFGYGHSAITEIQYIGMAVQDVSIILEHYLIGKRMTAFTIKSRRECNFQKEGCYLPTFHNKNGEIHEKNQYFQELYLKNEENLFATYGAFIKKDIPYEDARALLPYSFFSNFVMALTVHEMCLIINDLLYGEISQIAEAKELGEKFKEILLTVAPYTDVNVLNDKEIARKVEDFIERNQLIFEQEETIRFTVFEHELLSLLKKTKEHPEQYSYKDFEIFVNNIESFVAELKVNAKENDGKLVTVKEFQKILNAVESYLLITITSRVKLIQDPLAFLDMYEIDFGERKKGIQKTTLLSVTPNGDENAILSELANRYQIPFECAKEFLEKLKKEDPEIERKIMKGIMNSPHSRALEQVHYQFSYYCTLALTTHFQRQRLHSLMPLHFFPIIDLENYDIPQTILEDEEARTLFEEAEKQNLDLYKYLKQEGVKESDLVYFYISGNVLPFITSMNARYLIYLSRLRTCKKTQELTRKIVLEMCGLARKATPLIGECLGPNCNVLGYCTEGNDSCLKKKITRESLVLKKKS